MNVKDYINNNLLSVLVKPDSKKTEILNYDSAKKSLIVSVAAPADKNKANIELIRFFSKLLKAKVNIKSGLKSRQKILRIFS